MVRLYEVIFFLKRDSSGEMPGGSQSPHPPGDCRRPGALWEVVVHYPSRLASQLVRTQSSL